MNTLSYAIAPWITAMRLRTLPLALASIAMGSFLAVAQNRFNLPVFLLCVLTTIFLQILSNLANDYGDYVNGADHSDRKGPDRMVHTGRITPNRMKIAIGAFVLLSLTSGIALLSVSIGFSATTLKILLGFFTLGILSIIAAIKYTMGKNPYGYAGMGDVSVFLFFGVIGVSGSYYLQALDWTSDILLPSFACGFFSAAVLNVNNIRDIDSDAQAGKKSIPVRLGPKMARIYHIALLVLGVSSALLFTYLHYHSPFQFLFLLALPLILMNGLKVYKLSTPEALDPYLKQMAMTTLLFVITFGVGLILAV